VSVLNFVSDWERPHGSASEPLNLDLTWTAARAETVGEAVSHGRVGPSWQPEDTADASTGARGRALPVECSPFGLLTVGT